MSKGKVTLLIHINYSPSHFIINQQTFLRDINCDLCAFSKFPEDIFSLVWGTEQNTYYLAISYEMTMAMADNDICMTEVENQCDVSKSLIWIYAN